jgi:hypothetical protein
MAAIRAMLIVMAASIKNAMFKKLLGMTMTAELAELSLS